MRARTVAGMVLAAAAGLTAAGPKSASRPATSPAAPDRLAAESLAHQARSLGHLRDGRIVARAGRIGVLLKCAARHAPDEPRINRQLVDFYESSGELGKAAAAAERYIRARPGDYASAIRWMRLAQSGLDRAEDRVAFLGKVAADKRFAGAVRAAAAAGVSRIRLRQGDRGAARPACRQALSLDRYQPLAMEVQRLLRAKTGPTETFAEALAVFRGNPRSVHGPWQVAGLLQDAGNYKQALAFYEHAHAISQDRSPGASALEALLIDYFNARLDAGQAAKAVGQFAPLVKRHGGSLALHALMVEACRATGKDDQTKAHVEAMAKIYEPRAAPGARRSGPMAAELGWFNLHFRVVPKLAVQWAEEAARSAGGDPYVLRVLGAAQLATGKEKLGTKRLAGLVEKDPYAAALLAGYYYERDRPKEARAVLLKGAGQIRTGPAWRALAAVAAEHEVTLPPVKHAQAIARMLAEMPPQVMEMGRFPERYLRVAISAEPKPLAPGEPVAVTVELSNVSKHPIPLGQRGLCTPVVFLSLSVEGKVKASFPNLTPAALPAPRYLAPGGKVSQTARIDVGQAEALLARSPLAELKLTVSAMLDPLQVGDKLLSSAPGVKIAAATIRRAALFDASAGRASVEKALAGIGQKLRRGPPAAALSARQTGALLAYVQRVASGKVKDKLPAALSKSALLDMVSAHVRARWPLARSEMLAALHHVPLDEQIIALLGPCIQDRSALVRMRLVELLVAKRTSGHKTILDLFAGDRDRHVRDMASVLAGRK